MAIHIRRREFIATLGGTVAWPLAAHAQQPEQMRRIGVLMNRAADDPEGQAGVAAFQTGLEQLGWSGGRNVQIDIRWGDSRCRVDTALREGTRRAAARTRCFDKHALDRVAAATNAHHPHHFHVSDPVGSGFVASLPRPGGNATGFSTVEGSLGSK